MIDFGILQVVLWIELGLFIGWAGRGKGQIQMTLLNQNRDTIIVPPGCLEVELNPTNQAPNA